MEDVPIFSDVFRKTNDAGIEESGVFGTHRSWKNINCFEIVFLLLGVVAALATDGLTIYRLAQISSEIKDADFVYGILIIVNSIFLLLFLITGILQQRITDIVAFLISALMLTIYVVAHFVIRRTDTDDNENEKTIRLIRLIITVVFNICFVPLAIRVIRDYEREEFAKRLFGAFPAARWPFKIYNVYDCIARINTMLSISSFLLNLYNWNALEATDRIFLGIGIPLAFLWLGLGIGMIRLESRILLVIYYFMSLFQPAFIVYCLYSAIDFSPTAATTPISTTTITTTTTNTNTTSVSSTTTVISSTELTTMSSTGIPHIVNVPVALFVCVGANLLTHLSCMILAGVCARNFGKGLKEKVFNNRVDRWLQRR